MECSHGCESFHCKSVYIGCRGLESVTLIHISFGHGKSHGPLSRVVGRSQARADNARVKGALQQSVALTMVPDRQAELIDAARSLFMEKGYAAVGMREITARAGLTPTQAYRLGLAKEDLLAEISIRLTAEQLQAITAKAKPRARETLPDYVERYLLALYASDIHHIRIRKESAAYGWMWSQKYESRIVEQVMAMLQPVATALASHGLEDIPARGRAIWSLYYVGYRRAAVGGGNARDCLDCIRDSLALVLR